MNNDYNIINFSQNFYLFFLNNSLYFIFSLLYSNLHFPNLFNIYIKH